MNKIVEACFLLAANRDEQQFGTYLHLLRKPPVKSDYLKTHSICSWLTYTFCYFLRRRRGIDALHNFSNLIVLTFGTYDSHCMMAQIPPKSSGTTMWVTPRIIISIKVFNLSCHEYWKKTFNFGYVLLLFQLIDLALPSKRHVWLVNALGRLSIVIRIGISKYFGFEILFQLVRQAARKEHPPSPYRRQTYDLLVTSLDCSTSDLWETHGNWDH